MVRTNLHRATVPHGCRAAPRSGACNGRCRDCVTSSTGWRHATPSLATYLNYLPLDSGRSATFTSGDFGVQIGLGHAVLSPMN